MKSVLSEMLQQAKSSTDPNNFKDLLERVEGLLVNMKKEQDAHKALHDKMVAQCQDESAFRTQEISDATDSQKRAINARVRCSDALKSAMEAQQVLSNEIEEYEAERKNFVDLRALENKKFISRQIDLVQVLSYVKTFSSDYNNQNLSMVQMGENLLKGASKVGILANTIPILMSLSTKTKDFIITEDTKANLSNLVQKVQDEIDSAKKIESKSQETHTAYKTNVEKYISQLKITLTTIKVQINEMNLCVKNETAISEQAGSKMTRNLKLLKSAEKMCKEFAAEFVAATENRLEQVQTLQEIFQIVKQRYQNVSKNLQNIMDNLTEEWQAYVNTTEFKEFKAGEKHSIKDNEQGRKMLQTGKNAEERGEKVNEEKEEVKIVAAKRVRAAGHKPVHASQTNEDKTHQTTHNKDKNLKVSEQHTTAPVNQETQANKTKA